MKKSTFASVAFSAGLALAMSGCAASTDGSSAEENPGAAKTVDQQQQRVASATLALENAYDVQYVKGHIDADALQPLIYDVLQAFPEQNRAEVKAHIYDVIAKGQKDVNDMTAEQRAKMAAPVSADKLGSQQVEQIGAWGWGYPAGYAGYGAYGGCGGCGGLGYGYAGYGWPGYGIGYGAGYGLGYGAAYGVGYGTGLGYAGWGYPGWGWGWGGLGAFAFPSCGLGYGGFGWGW